MKLKKLIIETDTYFSKIILLKGINNFLKQFYYIINFSKREINFFVRYITKNELKIIMQF